jgi:CBS domain containing-hemolysin-like protein
MPLFVATVILVLVLVNTLYVAAEFSAVGARRGRLEELARRGSRAARRLLPVLRDPAELDRYVAACQIGITLSSLVLGAYGQAAIAVPLAPRLAGWTGLALPSAESLAVTGVLIVLTTLQVILGELAPKSIALQYPTRTALLTAAPMRVSLWLFRWFIAILNGSGVLILRWLGMPAAGSHRHIHSPEEIELLIAESRDGGLLEPHEQQRLHQALRLSLRSARQLMVPRTEVVGVDLQWSPARVLDAVIASPYTRLLVFDGSLDRVLGVVHVRDVATAFARNRSLDGLRRLIRPVPAVPESMGAEELLRTLREHHSHQALVLDEYGGLAGLATLQDVVSELLGEVRDEFQPAPAGVQTLADGRVRVAGQLPLAEAPAWLARRWSSEAQTIAGHVIRALRRLPRQGERVTVGGVPTEIERVEGRVPASLIVTRVDEEAPNRG